MSDEEIPFLGPDHRESRKGDRSRFHQWLFEYLVPQRPVARTLAVCTTAFAVVALSLWAIVSIGTANVKRPPESCDNVNHGYDCRPDISRYWGQYSPYFKIPSEISPDIPDNCRVSFAQVLSRHGARDPTAGKSASYANLIHRLKSQVQVFEGDFAFLADYQYELGQDQLTKFGQKQLVNLGVDFFNRYQNVAVAEVPFIRASGQKRVVDSGYYFSQGFHATKVANGGPDDPRYPYKIVTITEGPASNNSLSHSLCPAFEAENTGFIAQGTFASTFVPNITARLNAELTNANLTDQDAISMMDLCPFETVASPVGKPSSFCALFSQDEWKHYDYYQTLGKYYGHGWGSSLGPTQGVGFANELISRLTGKQVVDHTSVNNTLDSNPKTFPLDRGLYADFSHDNDITSILAALGLHNSTPMLSPTRIMTGEETRGYSAAWTVPFAARTFIEKMQCQGMEEELVRVLVNGRVLPLEACGSDALGKCNLSSFIGSLSFTQSGGLWDRCLDNAARTSSVT